MTESYVKKCTNPSCDRYTKYGKYCCFPCQRRAYGDESYLGHTWYCDSEHRRTILRKVKIPKKTPLKPPKKV